MPIKLSTLALAIASLFCVSTANGQSEPPFYYVIPLVDFELEYRKPTYFTNRNLVPYAIIEGAKDSWVCTNARQGGKNRDFELAIQSSQPLDQIRGKIFMPHHSKPELTEFKLELKKFDPVSKVQFFAAKEKYYRHLVEGSFVGRSWFRHKLNEARQMQDKKPDDSPNNGRRINNSLDLTFETFSGTRAITENIQLDRDLRIGDLTAQTIDVNTIKGITIKEVDWKPHLDKELPQLDELAHVVPFDQHVIFLQSVAAFQQSLSQVSNLLVPAFESIATESVDHEVIPKYLNQLQIDLQDLSKQDFFEEVKNLAITGSDPYSEIGTDLGIIIQMQNPEAAKKFQDHFLKHIRSIGEVEGIPNSGYRVSSDRAVSVFCFRQQDKLVITNSSYQIRYLKQCFEGSVESVASLTEFRFFRQRYTLGPDETAFVFMSDAAIRRWCSPKWRISQSRRMRALARIQQFQAEQMHACLKLDPNDRLQLKTTPGSNKSLGDLTISRTGVHSRRYGSIGFMTPISEMGVTKVSEEEKTAYERWRNGYERNWTQAFDPIGIQLKIDAKVVKADLSVIPLILHSSYRWFANGVPISPKNGDSHSNALVHFIAAPGVEPFFAPYFKGLKFVELYVDEDKSFWRDFDTEEEARKYFQKNLQQFPFGFALEFDKAESMESLLGMARSMAGEVISGDTTLRYKDTEYLKLRIDEKFLFPDHDFVDLYVLKKDGRVLFSLSHQLVKRAIQRMNGTKNQKRAWLGKNMSIQINQQLFRTLEGFSSEFYRSTLRDRSWNNIPILNEWKREFPDSDPLQIHRAYWGQRLLCSGGGQLKWDEKAQSFSSSKFGSPSRPRIPMGTPYPWRGIKRFDAGVSFETGGLRAKVELHKK